MRYRFAYSLESAGIHFYNYRICLNKCPSLYKHPLPLFDDPIVHVYVRYTYKRLVCVSAHPRFFSLSISSAHGRLLERIRYVNKTVHGRNRSARTKHTRSRAIGKGKRNPERMLRDMLPGIANVCKLNPSSKKQELYNNHPRPQASPDQIAAWVLGRSKIQSYY